MAGVLDWSTTDIGNSNAAGINFAEGQTPASLNDSARRLMSQVKSSTVINVDTVEALLAAPKAKLSLGVTAFTRGRSVVGDLGGGMFWWDPEATTATNTGTVFASAEGGPGRWIRILTGNVRPEWFGAKGNGVTDDKQAIYDACQLCFDTGKSLELRGGAFYLHGRVEVHGTFNVYGNGARIEYLAVGNTLIAGLGTGHAATPSAWVPQEVGSFDSRFPVSIYNIQAANKGDDHVTFVDTPTVPVGGYFFMCGPPASNSTPQGSNPPNYIPRVFEWCRVKSIVGNTVNLESPLTESYTGTRAAFYCAGNAVNCTINDLIITTQVDAYQFVRRSGVGTKTNGLRFEGIAAVGASTFHTDTTDENWTVVSTFGPWSYARGSGKWVLRNVRWAQRVVGAGPVPQANCLFFEESMYDGLVDSVECKGGIFSIRSMDHSNSTAAKPVTRRVLRVINSTFDTRITAAGVATAPMQNGSKIGLDVEFDHCSFLGEVIAPDPGQYPGISGQALCFTSTQQTYDSITFGTCYFESLSGDRAYKGGSADLGTTKINERMSTFVTCLVPDSRYTTRGAWIDILQNMDPAKYSAPADGASPAVRVDQRDVIGDGLVSLVSGLSDGVSLMQFNPGYKPLSTQAGALRGFTAGGQLVMVGYIIASTGVVTLDSGITGANGARSISLKGLTFPLDR